MTGNPKPQDGGGAGSPRDSALLGRSISGAAWLTVEMCGLQGLSLLIFGYLMHLLTPSEFGLASIGFVATQALRETIQDRIPEAAAVRPSPLDEEWTTAFWLSAVVGIVLMAALLVVASPLENLLRMPGLSPVLRGMAVVVVTCGVGRTHEQWLIRNMRFRTLALRGLAGALAGGVAGIVSARAGWGVYAIVLQQVVGGLVALALMWSTCPWRPQLRFDWPVARRILAHVRDTAPGGLAYIVGQTCDTVLVGVWFGAGAAGLYGLAKRLRLALQLVIVTPITGVVRPLFIEAISDPEQHRRIVGRALGTVALVCGPIFAGASFLSRDLIVFVFGPQWAAASPTFAVLAIGGFGMALQPCFNIILLTHGWRRWTSYLTAFEIAMSIGSFTALAYSFGPGIAAPTFVAPLVISVPVAAMLAMRSIDRPAWAWIGDITPGVLATLVMVCGLSIASPRLEHLGLTARLGDGIFVGALLYASALAVMFPGALAQSPRKAGAFLQSLKLKLNLARA